MAVREALDHSVIRENFVYLAKELPPDVVAPQMLSKSLLTPKEYAAYLVKKGRVTSSDRSAYLLQCLLKRKPGSLQSFCAILRDICPAANLADFLEEARSKAVEGEKVNECYTENLFWGNIFTHSLDPEESAAKLTEGADVSIIVIVNL